MLIMSVGRTLLRALNRPAKPHRGRRLASSSSRSYIIALISGQEMDLKSGTLFWPDRDGRLGHHPRLRNDLRCDVAILGAGLTGALAAYTLSAEGFDVVVLDKRDVGRGSTSASTAL